MLWLRSEGSTHAPIGTWVLLWGTMNPADATDHALLQAWRDGDDKAGTTLVRRHFESLSRFFRQKAADHRTDLMQRTWLGCVESRDRVPDHVPFKVYLLGIARRVLIHHYRSKSKDARTSPADDAGPTDTETPTPTGALAMVDEEKLLLQALRRLPLDMQLTLELFYWESLKIDEVAQVLEIPPGTVKSRLSRAKTLLREQIQELEAPNEVAMSTEANLDKWARSIRRFLDRSEP